MNTLDSLIARALVVMNETRKKLNTATRVGSLLRDILTFISNMLLGILLKGSKANLAAIQAITTKTKGDTYRAEDTGHFWTWDGTAWNDIGEIIPANVATTDDIAQLQRNIILNNLHELVVISNNLFNKSTCLKGYYLSYITGGFAVSEDYYASNFIPVKPSTAYSIRYSQQITFFDDKLNFITGIASATNNIFVTPENAYYLCFPTLAVNLNTQQLNEGNILLSFDDYAFRIDAQNIGIEKIEGLFKEQNTLNENYVIGGGNYLTSNQLLANNTPAEFDGRLVKLRYFTPAIASFYVFILDRQKDAQDNYTNVFEVITKQLVTSKSIGENFAEVNLDIKKGQFVGYMQRVADNQRIPYYFVNIGNVAGWWQDGAGILTDVGSKATLSFQSIGSVSAGFLIQKSIFVTRDELKETQEIITKIVIVERNAADFNSIRETIALLNADYYNRYIVFVPRGRWHECDLNGKKYVKIVGEDMYNTILYNDGNSPKSTPSDYSLGYSNTPLNQIVQAYKHIFFIMNDIEIENLSMESNDVKYCMHIDNRTYNNIIVRRCRMTASSGVNYPVGIGISADQNIRFSECEFIRSNISLGIFIHNWNNQKSPCKFIVENSKFTGCGFLVVSELGSDNNDEFDLINCYSDTSGLIIFMVDYNAQGNTYWVNPSTGVNESNPQNVPYNIKLNTLGSNVNIAYSNPFAGTLKVVTRPNFLNYIISNYFQVWETATVFDVGNCIQGYNDGQNNDYSKYVGTAPFVGVIVAINGDKKLIVTRGKIAVTPISGTVGNRGQHVKINTTGKLEFTNDNSEEYVGLYIGIINDVYKVQLI